MKKIRVDVRVFVRRYDVVSLDEEMMITVNPGAVIVEIRESLLGTDVTVTKAESDGFVKRDDVFRLPEGDVVSKNRNNEFIPLCEIAEDLKRVYEVMRLYDFLDLEYDTEG